MSPGRFADTILACLTQYFVPQVSIRVFSSTYPLVVISGLMAESVGVLVKRVLTILRAEVEALSVMSRDELCLLFIDHHSADGIFLQRFTSYILTLNLRNSSELDTTVTELIAIASPARRGNTS
jgi:hypothetical protein